MIDATVSNIEESFSSISVAELTAAAEAIWSARQVFTLGVGAMNANARLFSYLASTGMTLFHTIPRAGSTPAAMTMKPYRTEVIETVRIAREQNMTVIALSDSPASPIIRQAQHGFVVAVETPQFFPSSVSTIAVLETLLSLVIAVASDEIVERVEKFHRRRYQLGIYSGEPE